MLTARTALLLVLRQGPAYARQLARRIEQAGSGRVRMSEGTIHPALRALKADGLVTAWKVVPGQKRGGRARTYYELTVAGVREAEAQAHALLELAAGVQPAGRHAPDPRVMRERAERVANVSRAVALMREALPRLRRRA